LETVFQFGIGFIIALSGVLIPGPLLVYVISGTMKRGAKVGTLAAVGHCLFEVVIISLILLGLGFILQNPISQTIIGGVGGGLLLVYGVINISKVQNSKGLNLNMVDVKYNSVLGGIIFSSILNPSVILWWSTIGVAMLLEAFLVAALIGAIFWSLGHFAADLFFYSLVSNLTWKGKRVVGSQLYRKIIVGCGVVLILFGIYFIVKYVILLAI